jgi:membrane fusion protein, multidrug efflux system
MNTPKRFSAPPFVIPAAGLTLALLFAWRGHFGGAPAAAGEKQAGSASSGEAAVAVDTVRVSRNDMPVFLEGLATVQGFYTVTVTARVDGELQKIGFVEGQKVKKGDLIGQIDPRPYQAVLDQSVAARGKDLAQVASARADLERYRLLEPKNLTSRQTLDNQIALVAELEAQIQADQAHIDSARTQLGYTTIVSPIDGNTGIRRVDPGNNVHAADTSGIVVVTQVQPIAAIVTLPEENLPVLSAALAQGQVVVTALSRDDKTELDRGTVQLVDNQIDPATGTIRIKATFANPHNALWPGEFINARVLLRTDRNALTVPAGAIQRGANGMFAYVVRSDSTVEVRPLKVSEENGGMVLITEGLSEGEEVVTSNQYRLHPGVPVRSNANTSASTDAMARPKSNS